MNLKPEDFPLQAIGALIYRRTESSPMITAADERLAADLVERLAMLHFTYLSALASR